MKKVITEYEEFSAPEVWNGEFYRHITLTDSEADVNKYDRIELAGEDYAVIGTMDFDGQKVLEILKIRSINKSGFKETL